jgi:tetratricopeptide (TPR) repeat protein
VPLIEENLKEALVKKEWDKVIETANTWRERDKATPVPYLALSYAYYVKGDYPKASESLDYIDSQEKKESLLVWTEEFVQEYPQDSIPYLLKGDVSIRLKKYNDAIKEFDKAEKLEPSFFLIYVAKGMLYALQSNYDLAINNFTEAIKLKTNLADTYNNRGIVYYSQENCKLALSDFEQAIKINPSFTLAYLGRGKVYQCLGRADLASNDFQKAKEINQEGITFGQQTVHDPLTGKVITQKSWHVEFGGGGGKANLQTTNVPFMKKSILEGSASVSMPKLGGVDSQPKGKTKKIRKGEVVGEKVLDDSFIDSASYFLLYSDQFLFKEKRK